MQAIQVWQSLWNRVEISPRILYVSCFLTTHLLSLQDVYFQSMFCLIFQNYGFEVLLINLTGYESTYIVWSQFKGHHSPQHVKSSFAATWK